MNQAALCPSCKRDVVFDTTGGASICPECGARFEINTEVTRRSRARPVHGLIFVAWMFAPAAVALIAMAVLTTGKNPQFGQALTDYPVVFVILSALSCISCYAACSWLMGRFTDKRWVCVIVGIFLGATILFCNVIVAVFGSCAITGGIRS